MTFNDLTDANKALRLDDLAEANADRCTEVFHLIDAWSPTDWACAMAGECGEVCNEVKKLRRRFYNSDDFERTFPEDFQKHHAVEAARIAEEIADMVIYADLLCQRLGISLEDAIREKFNTVSENYGSKIRI